MEYTNARPAPRGGDLRYLVRATIFILVLFGLGALFRGPLLDGFAANAYLNGTILALLGFGIAYTLRGLVVVLSDSRAIRRAGCLVEKARASLQTRGEVTERILGSAPKGIGSFLSQVNRVVSRDDGTATLPYLLDSVATRADDRRALVRYLTGALVLLGLIGTFYGLLETLGGVRAVLGSLAGQQETDTLALLSDLQNRLAKPLGGMGMAFSSSLFGLLASLVLAFMELQLFHAQNEVHAELESLVVSDLVPLWRDGDRRSAADMPAAGKVVPDYIAALLETTAERLDRMTSQVERLVGKDDGADRVSERTAALGEQIAALRSTLEGVERERTEELRHELRILTRTLARSRSDDAA